MSKNATLICTQSHMALQCYIGAKRHSAPISANRNLSYGHQLGASLYKAHICRHKQTNSKIIPSSEAPFFHLAAQSLCKYLGILSSAHTYFSHPQHLFKKQHPSKQILHAARSAPPSNSSLRIFRLRTRPKNEAAWRS